MTNMTRLTKLATVVPSEDVARYDASSGGGIFACILIGPRPGGHAFRMEHMPDLDDKVLEHLAGDALDRINSFLVHGPDDGPFQWHKRSDGDYQVWLRDMDVADPQG